MKLWWLVLGWVAILAGCGEDQEQPPGLEIYAGNYLVTELFRQQSGNQCPVAREAFENQLQVLVNKSQFEARFSSRYPELYGEIHSDFAFWAIDGESKPDENLELNGVFQNENEFTGLIKEVWTGCTRFTDLLAKRVVDE